MGWGATLNSAALTCAGIPGPTEARVVGNLGVTKAAWIAGTIVVQGIVRPSRMKKVTLMDGWTWVNLAIQLSAMGLLVYLTGWGPLKFLAFSTVFAIGLHPQPRRQQQHVRVRAEYRPCRPRRRSCQGSAWPPA